MKNGIFLALTALLCLTPCVSQAAKINIKDAHLKCQLNRSENLYIIDTTPWDFRNGYSAVVFAEFNRSPLPLKLDNFFVDRGTNIYSFSGIVDGHKYEGNTYQDFHDPNDSFAVSLNYSIDGVEQRPVPCMRTAFSQSY